VPDRDPETLSDALDERERRAGVLASQRTADRIKDAEARAVAATKVDNRLRNLEDHARALNGQVSHLADGQDKLKDGQSAMRTEFFAEHGKTNRILDGIVIRMNQRDKDEEQARDKALTKRELVFSIFGAVGVVAAIIIPVVALVIK
jgi:hypothetical protein